MIELESVNKWVIVGTYTRRELINLIEGEMELTQFDKHPRINRTNNEMVISLDELENKDNLEDGSLSNVLLRYYVTGSDEFMCLEPATPQYKRLKNGEFASLIL